MCNVFSFGNYQKKENICKIIKLMVLVGSILYKKLISQFNVMEMWRTLYVLVWRMLQI